jgi:dTDP-4-amino-4,6-dideoxygalactose transaminase
MKIPFIRFDSQYQLVQSQLNERIQEVLQEMQFIRGRHVTMFENTFAQALKIDHCIGTGNGTDALIACLKCLGIKTGDEVIVPSFTWISPAEAVTVCGAKPVFADVNEETFNIDMSSIRTKVTKCTKAIIVVHLYGQAAAIREIRDFCNENDLYLIEDCAQAHLAFDGDQAVGTFGDVSAFSFYPTKNLGAMGDAGCVVTSNDSYAERLRRLTNHGALQKDDHLFEGFNSRMDTLQAAILLAKLPYLGDWNNQRLQNALLYNRLLKGTPKIVTPSIRSHSVHTFHLYVIKCNERDKLQKYLFDKGIGTGIHYPQAVPFLPAYQYMNHFPSDFPVANQLQNQVLSLPIYPGLTTDEISYVCEKIKECV